MIPVSPAKYYAGRLFAPLLGRMTVDTGIDASGLSRDPQAVQAYLADPLNHHRISLQTADTLLSIGRRLDCGRAPFMGTSVLLSHGTADRVVAFEATRGFFDRLVVGPGCTKDAYWVEGGYHERTRLWCRRGSCWLVHMEPGREEAIRRYSDWILSRAQ